MTDTSPAPAWRDLVRPYASASTRRSLTQLLITAAVFLTTTSGLIAGLYFELWFAFILAVPAAAFLVRLFMIQHDCGHGSFFRQRWANSLLGSTLGVLTLTPYVFWRDRHATHHATSGNLDRRGFGDVVTFTVREYLAQPWWRRLGYRLYRHPLVIFGLGPTWLFVLRHRFPSGHPWREFREWRSVLGTNAALTLVLVIIGHTIGLGPFLLGYGPVFLAAATIGVWLFYVQHQFEDTYWAYQRDWKFRVAAVQGSSMYDLPRFLHWLTCHIGLHHLHHLSSRIPNYRLRECLERHPELQRVPRLSLRESLGCARLALWCEERRKLVSFKTALNPTAT